MVTRQIQNLDKNITMENSAMLRESLKGKEVEPDWKRFNERQNVNQH